MFVVWCTWLTVARCSLRVVRCLLVVVYCGLFDVCCLLFVVCCCVLSGVRRRVLFCVHMLLLGVCCMVFVVCCSLRVVWSLLRVNRCSLLVVCLFVSCLLFADVHRLSLLVVVW